MRRAEVVQDGERVSFVGFVCIPAPLAYHHLRGQQNNCELGRFVSHNSVKNTAHIFPTSCFNYVWA